MTEGTQPDPEPAAEDRALADQLHAGRPVPTAGFRGTLGRHLAIENPGYGPRPNRLRLMASGYLAAGALLLALGLLQATGTI